VSREQTAASASPGRVRRASFGADLRNRLRRGSAGSSGGSGSGGSGSGSGGSGSGSENAVTAHDADPGQEPRAVKLIGSSLADTLAYEAGLACCAGLDAPELVVRCCDYITAEGSSSSDRLEREGLFRITPSLSGQRVLLELLEATPKERELSLEEHVQNDNPHDACALLKKYLRMLEPKLLPPIDALQSLIVEDADNNGAGNSTESLREWLASGGSGATQLSAGEHKTLQTLLKCWGKVVATEANCMTAEGLATVLAPNLFRQDDADGASPADLSPASIAALQERTKDDQAQKTLFTQRLLEAFGADGE
jgi:RhoGAP domain